MSSPPPTKRPRIEEETKDKSEPDDSLPLSGEKLQLPTLTPELWAICMEWLLFKEMFECCAVSKNLLSDVMPKVRVVIVDSPEEMKVTFAQRFSGVEVVRIRCLCEKTIDARRNLTTLAKYSDKVIFRVGPFISGFPRLRYLDFWGKCFRQDDDDSSNVSTTADLVHVGNFAAFDDLIRFSISDPRLGTRYSIPIGNLVKSLCACYAAGIISQNLYIPEVLDFHICLQRDRNASDRDCSQCREVCKSFPVERVANHLTGCQSKMRDKNYAEFQRSICLPAMDVIKILMKRKGGEAAVRRNYTLFVALINERYDIVNALIKLDLLPEVTRNDIETGMRKSWKDGVILEGEDAKPECINSSVFKLLVRKGIPLRKSDFQSIKEGPLPELREGDDDEWVDLDDED